MKSVSGAELDRISLTGETAEAFCQGQLSCDVAALDVNDMAPSLLLNPQGKLVSILRIRKMSESEFELYTNSGWGDSVKGALERFNLGSKVEVGLDQVSVVRYRALKASHVELDNDCDYLQEFWGAEWVSRDYLDCPLESEGTFNDCRIAAGMVEMGIEIVAGDIPASAPIISGFVSFDKGCYLGQELVARMSSRKAQPPQRIVRVYGADLEVGDEIVAEEETVGKVLSMAADQQIGGLALLKRKSGLGEYGTNTGQSVTVAQLEFDSSKSS